MIKTIILDFNSGRWKDKGLRNLPVCTGLPLKIDHLRILHNGTDIRGAGVVALFPLLDPVKLSLEDSNMGKSFFSAGFKGLARSNQLDASCSGWTSLVQIDVSSVWLETSYEVDGMVDRSPFQRLPLVAGRTILVSFNLHPAASIPLNHSSTFRFFKSPSVVSVLHRADVSFEIIARSEEERTAFLKGWKELEAGRFFGDAVVRVAP